MNKIIEDNVVLNSKELQEYLMWQYIFLSLRRQRGRNILASFSFLLAACALVLLSATTQTTVLQAKQIISQNWRSTYDLVVLPSSTNAFSAKTVSPEQLGSRTSGISVKQYQQIKTLPGIAVAAPVALIGYAQYPFTYVQIGPQHPSPGFYQLTWTQTSFDGQKYVQYHNSRTLYISTCTGNSTSARDQAFSDLGVDPRESWCTSNGRYSAGIPDIGTFLLAAIDPSSEDQLVPLKKSITSGRMLTQQDTLKTDMFKSSFSASGGQDVPNYDIPLLINTQLPGKVNLTSSFIRFNTSTTDPQQVLAQGGLSVLQKQTLFSGNVPLIRNNPHMLTKATSLDWNGQSWQNDTQQLGVYDFNFIATPSGLTYENTNSPSGQSASSYKIAPSITQNPYNTSESQVAFQNLTPFPGGTDRIETADNVPYHTYGNAGYTYQPVGYFAGQNVAGQADNILNWLPENTYTIPPTTLRYDAQGHPVQSTTLLPTTNPAGFIPQAPFAITTLDAARRIRGENCISVIRVRVAGNVTPDEAGWKRVSQVAQLIHQRTGLQVAVTLGSSPKPTLVYVPGLNKGQNGAAQTIAPVGWVDERWIAIGVGLVYLNQLGQTRVLLLGAVLLVCLGYLIVTLSSLITAQRKEFAILSAVGWEPWQPAGLFMVQTLILAACGGIVGTGLALLLAALIGASPSWAIVLWTLPAVLALALIGVLYPLWQLWHIQPVETLRSGATISRTQSTRLNRSLETFIPAVTGIALRNLARSRVRTSIALGSLFLSAILLTVMVNGILAFRQTLQGTLLGDYVLLQTAVPQLAGAAFALLLTFLSIADLLLLQVHERTKEIGLLQSVGWRLGIVQRMFVQEGMTLAFLGAIPGVLVALAVLAVQHSSQSATSALLVALGAVILILLISALATIPAIRAVNRTQLMDVLRAE